MYCNCLNRLLDFISLYLNFFVILSVNKVLIYDHFFNRPS
jgi:hypothetical protein